MEARRRGAETCGQGRRHGGLDKMCLLMEAEIRVIGRHCKTLLLLCVASVVLFYPALLALYLELRLSKAGIVPSKTSTAISLMSKSSRGPEV